MASWILSAMSLLASHSAFAFSDAEVSMTIKAISNIEYEVQVQKNVGSRLQQEGYNFGYTTLREPEVVTVRIGQVIKDFGTHVSRERHKTLTIGIERLAKAALKLKLTDSQLQELMETLFFNSIREEIYGEEANDKVGIHLMNAMSVFEMLADLETIRGKPIHTSFATRKKALGEIYQALRNVYFAVNFDKTTVKLLERFLDRNDISMVVNRHQIGSEFHRRMARAQLEYPKLKLDLVFAHFGPLYSERVQHIRFQKRVTPAMRAEGMQAMHLSLNEAFKEVLGKRKCADEMIVEIEQIAAKDS